MQTIIISNRESAIRLFLLMRSLFIAVSEPPFHFVVLNQKTLYFVGRGLRKFFVPEFQSANPFVCGKVFVDLFDLAPDVARGDGFDIFAVGSARFFRSASRFFDRTRFPLGGTSVELPGAASKVVEYARLYPGRVIRRGETVADGSLSLGDHLFVERFSLYLREPRRGDVTVFTTEGLRIPAVIDGELQLIDLSDVSGFFYIKRLAGLPGDTLRIEGDQLLVRPAGEKEFRPVQELADAFRKVYSGKGGYQGHVNGIGEIHLSQGSEYTVPPDHYFMLGDNSRFSQDSRFFGAVPRRNLIGRAWFVFWPFTRRWGWADRPSPLPVPTGDHNGATFPVMYLQ